MKVQPPRWADRFLEWYCRSDVLEDLQGDLHEIYDKRCAGGSRRIAKIQFVWLVLRSLRISTIKGSKKLKLNTLDMYKNYLKISWRALSRSKLYTSINISGLAVGMAVFMLIFLYVRDELSYDTYHQKADNIYRVVSDLTVPDGFFEFAVTPPHLGSRLSEDFPEVLGFVRLTNFGSVLNVGEKSFRDDIGLFNDPSFFKFFDIPVVEADREDLLADPFTIILTDRASKKYFGDENPIGKTIQIDGVEQSFSVVGIMENVPSNTHFYFDFLISMSTREALDIIREGQWFYLDYFTYLLLPENHPIEELHAKLPDFVEKHIGKAQKSAGQSYEFQFQKLKDIHLKSHRDVEIGGNGNIQYVYIFSLIAIFIVIIACVNFMNLSTARASKRAKEIGLRKVVGAIRRQLVAQFLIESVLISILSFLLALGLVVWTLPYFNQIVSKELILINLFEGQTILFWLALVFVSGFLAGIYPAMVLSRFKPVRALNAASPTGTENTLLRKGLVVFQLMISTILIMGTIVINKQLRSMQGQNLGFDKEQMLTVNFNGDEDVQARMDEIRSEFKKNANVSGVTFSRFIPSTGVSNWYTTYEITPGETLNASMYGYLVDPYFIDTYGLQILAGRGFDETMSTDVDEAFVINESAVRKMGFQTNKEALGIPINQLGKNGNVVGVIQNFNFKTLHNEIEPLVLQLMPQFLSIMTIKMNSGSTLETINELEESWNSMISTVPFEVSFLDQDLDRRYEAEVRTGNVFSIFSGLAIFIAALGLFALSTLSAEQQRKNISVRKVLGASEAGIVYLFSIQFLKLAILAFVISTPLAFFFADSWLDNFSYRTTVSFLVFLKGGFLIVIITLLTVSFQSFRLTRLNPAQNLRSE